MPIKKTQGGAGAATNGFVQSSGCLALEPQDWSDGINQYVMSICPPFLLFFFACVALTGMDDDKSGMGEKTVLRPRGDLHVGGDL